MKSGPLRTSVEIRNPLGLHMRFASAFAEAAQGFACEVWLEKGPSRVSGKSWLDLMLLGAAPGTELILEVDGGDAVPALAALAMLLSSEKVDGWDADASASLL